MKSPCVKRSSVRFALKTVEVTRYSVQHGPGMKNQVQREAYTDIKPPSPWS